MTLLWQLAGGLLGVPLVGQILTGAVQRGLEAKVGFDQAVVVVLGLLNLPSQADVQRIMTKLDVLQGTLANLSFKVDEVLERSPAADDLDTFDDPV